MSYIDRFNPDKLDRFVMPDSGGDPYFVEEVTDNQGRKSFNTSDILLDDTKEAVIEFTEENFEKACISYFQKLREIQNKSKTNHSFLDDLIKHNERIGGAVRDFARDTVTFNLVSGHSFVLTRQFLEDMPRDQLQKLHDLCDFDLKIELSKPIQGIIDIWDIIDDLQEHSDDEIGEIFISAMLDDDPGFLIDDITQIPGHKELLFHLNNEKHFRIENKYLKAITDSKVIMNFLERCSDNAWDAMRLLRSQFGVGRETLER